MSVFLLVVLFVLGLAIGVMVGAGMMAALALGESRRTPGRRSAAPLHEAQTSGRSETCPYGVEGISHE